MNRYIISIYSSVYKSIKYYYKREQLHEIRLIFIAHMAIMLYTCS